MNQCSRCGGTGVVQENMDLPCAACEGTGEIFGAKCPICEGAKSRHIRTDSICPDCRGLGHRPTTRTNKPQQQTPQP